MVGFDLKYGQINILLLLGRHNVFIDNDHMVMMVHV